MIAELSKVILHNPDKRGRALALFLLATISWGANVEIIHHHGDFGSIPRTAEQQQPFTEGVGSSDKETSSKKNSSRDECLICRLHQNLLVTALQPSPHEIPATTYFLKLSTSLFFHVSQLTSSERGRAPPPHIL